MRMKTRRWLRGSLAMALSVSLLSGILPPNAVEATQKKTAQASTVTQSLKIATLSDTHYLSPDMIKDTEDYTTDLNSDRKMYAESGAILDKLIECVEEDKPDVLFVSGDLTKDGEQKCEEEFADKLEALKKTLPNLHVYVINGNHDINNSLGKDFNTEDGEAVAADTTTPAEFKEIYGDVTYKDSSVVDTYTPPEGKEAGSLSYVARPADGFTVIAIDSGRYSADNTDSKKDEHETSGQISEDLEKWILEQIKIAKDRGDTVLGMEHHGMVEHFSMEKDILSMYLVNDYSRLATEFADAGMSYIFTGHMHANDIAKVTTEAGNTLYDIETGSVVTYPSPTRAITLTRTINKDNGNVDESMDVKTTTNVGPITYTDPLTGKTATIEDATAYGKEHGFSNALFTTTINSTLNAYYSQILTQGGSKKTVEGMLGEMLGSSLGIKGDITLKKIVDAALPLYLPEEEDTSAGASATQIWFDSDNNQVNIKINQGSASDPVWFKLNKKAVREALDVVFSSADSILKDDPKMLDSIVQSVIETLTAVPVYEGSDKTVLDFLNYIYQGHISGNDSVASMPEWVQKAMEDLKSGALVDRMVNKLIPVVSDAVLKVLDKVNLRELLGVSGVNASTYEFTNLDGRTPLVGYANSTTYGMLQMVVVVLSNNTPEADGFTYMIPENSTVKDLFTAVNYVLSQSGSGMSLDLSAILSSVLNDTKDAEGNVVKEGLLTSAKLRDQLSGLLYSIAVSMGDDTNIPDDNNTVLNNSWTAKALIQAPVPSATPSATPNASSSTKPSETITIEAPKSTVKAPAKAVITKIKKNGTKNATVILKKISGAKGYQVQYSVNKKFTGKKTKTVMTTANKKKITKLSQGKKYYVRTRAYKVSDGKKVYGKWSAVKNFKN